jgi:iron(III) transport system permease protein
LRAAGLWFGLAFTTLLAVVALVFGGKWLVQIGHVPPHQQWSWRLGPARWLAAALLWVTMFIVAGVPLGNMIYKAGMHTIQNDTGRVRTWSLIQTLQRVASAPIEYAADFELSAAIGAAAATAAVLAGLPLAWSLRGQQRTLSFVILCFLALCLTIPGPFLGIGLIHILNRPPSSPLAFLAVLYDSHFAPWLAQTIRALPLVALVLWTALASIPQATLEAAALDGAGWWSSLLWIAIPERRPAIIAAWLVGFAIACGELPATVLVMPPGRSGLAVHVFQLLHYGMDDRVAAISLVMVGATALLGGAAMVILVVARQGKKTHSA